MTLKEILDSSYGKVLPVLIYASYYGLVTLVKALLEHGANPLAKDDFGWSPLMHAVRNGQMEITLIFLKTLNINNIDTNLLLLATASENESLLAYLMSLGLPSSQDPLCGVTELGLAVCFGNSALVEKIYMSFPSQVDEAASKTGMTPLMLSVIGGHIALSEEFINLTDDIDAKNNENTTALLLAQRLGFTEIAGILKKKSRSILSLSLPTHCLPVDTGPLTPNILCKPDKPLSPFLKGKEKCVSWIKQLKMRSKSASRRKNLNLGDDEKGNTLEYILKTENLQYYWPILKEQEVTLRVFLTFKEGDLEEIGIKKRSARQKLLLVINHYKRVFSL